MESIRVFLRTPLFTVRGEAHLPPGTFVVEGRLREMVSGGMILDVETWMNEEGLALAGEPRALFLPVTKIDHVLLLEKAGPEAER